MVCEIVIAWKRAHRRIVRAKSMDEVGSKIPLFSREIKIFFEKPLDLTPDLLILGSNQSIAKYSFFSIGFPRKLYCFVS
ncbi:MAG: hypothetical protein RLZZ519_2327 [Bacteroidota bacterium]|jgi:hypothetical protein